MRMRERQMTLAEIKARTGNEYLTAPPPSLPADGRVLVHNVRAVGANRTLGHMGFRAWLCAADPAKQMPCDCDSAGLGPHYRTESAVTRASILETAPARRTVAAARNRVVWRRLNGWPLAPSRGGTMRHRGHLVGIVVSTAVGQCRVPRNGHLNLVSATRCRPYARTGHMCELPRTPGVPRVVGGDTRPRRGLGGLRPPRPPTNPTKAKETTHDHYR